MHTFFCLARSFVLEKVLTQTIQFILNGLIRNAAKLWSNNLYQITSIRKPDKNQSMTTGQFNNWDRFLQSNVALKDHSFAMDHTQQQCLISKQTQIPTAIFRKSNITVSIILTLAQWRTLLCEMCHILLMAVFRKVKDLCYQPDIYHST